MPLWLAYDHWTGLRTAENMVARQMAQASDSALVPGTQAFLNKVTEITAAQSPELVQRAHELLSAPHLFGYEIGLNVPAFIIALIITAILAIAMTSQINIGVRHVMPVYAPLAVAAAAAVVELRRFRIVSVLLVLWLFIDGVAAHPDYLPWFNGFAREPASILNDSNLDWGQDVLRLVRYARAEHIPSISLLLFTATDLDRVGLPPHTAIKEVQDIHGWFAISEMEIAIGNTHSERVRMWLDRLIGGKPYKRIGTTIRVYYLR